MTVKRFIFLLMTFSGFLAAQTVFFSSFFVDSTLRVDYYHTGDADDEIITLDQVFCQGVWPGPKEHLIDTFNNGKYYVKLREKASGRLIYSKGYATIFGEYQTTDGALKGVKRTYHETVRVPFPKETVHLVIESRDRENQLIPIFNTEIDPHAVNVIRQEADTSLIVYEALKNGEPENKVDLVWVGEGYTRNEVDQFKADIDRYVTIFFSVEPYSNFRDRFNITGVLRPSADSGTDEPTRKSYKNTAVRSSFNSLGSPRYLLTEGNRELQDIAAAVPHDAVVILVNHERYGGGGIYNFYAITTVNHDLSDHVFLHEFGHSFAGLADEYYLSSTAYNDFYPLGIEPNEPNITRLLDPENVKWKDLLSQGIDVPTDWGKARREELQQQRGAFYRMRRQETARREKEGATEEEVEKTRVLYQAQMDSVSNLLTELRAHYAYLEGKTGVFEGGGYATRGIYRPALDCLMKSNAGFKFCRVCQKAIENMIRHYTE